MQQTLEKFFHDNKKINVNVDNDGMMSSAILKKFYDCDVNGFNNNDKIVIHEENTPYDELVYVDLHVGYPEIKSIDQHMVSINKGHNDMIFNNPNKINPNVDYGVYWRMYGDKFPFSTAIYLLARAEGEGKDMSSIDLNKQVTADFKLGDLIWQTDSSHDNYFKYNRNASNWLKKLREMSNNGAFINTLIEWLDKIPANEEERKNYTLKIGNWYKERFGCVNNHGSIREGFIKTDGSVSDNVLTYLTTIGELFDVNMEKIEQKRFKTVNFSCKSFTYNDVKERFDSTKLFSYGFIWGMGRERNIRASYVAKQV